MSDGDSASAAQGSTGDPSKSEPENNKDKDDGKPSDRGARLNYALLVACVSALCAAVSAYSAWNSSHVARDSSKLSHEVYVMNERPWAGVKEAILAKPLRPGRPVTVNLTIINMGKTPAENVELTSSLTLMNSPADENTKFDPGSAGTGSKGLMWPGTERVAIDSTAGVLSQKDIAAIDGEKLFLYEVGTLKYEDAFHQKHSTEFCYMYRAELSLRLAMCSYNKSNTAD